MKLLISPAKKMRREDTLGWKELPEFLSRTEELKVWLQSLTPARAKALWQCSDKLTALNLERLAGMDLHRDLTPAILAYEGIQYQYMAPGVMEDAHLRYLQQHLRILSAFYGVLKPFDAVVPYRLEMQARGAPEGKENLYDFWGDSLYRALTADGDRVLVNLASREYARSVEPYLQPEDTFLTVVFGEPAGEKVVQKGTMAKMARGEMVRFLAEIRGEEPEAMQRFDRLGYRFCPERSTAASYVFLCGAG